MYRYCISANTKKQHLLQAIIKGYVKSYEVGLCGKVIDSQYLTCYKSLIDWPNLGEKHFNSDQGQLWLSG